MKIVIEFNVNQMYNQLLAHPKTISGNSKML